MSTDSSNASGITNTTTIKNTDDDFNDFDNPVSQNIDIEQTMGEFRENFTRLMEMLRNYERLIQVNHKFDDVGKTIKNHGNSIRDIIRNSDNDIVAIKDKYLIPDNTEYEVINENSKNIENKASQESRTPAQYNDYNERHKDEDYRMQTEEEGANDVDQEDDQEREDEIARLIGDILLKYCRENLTVFERNLRNDAYYNTLKRIIELFVTDILSVNTENVGTGSKKEKATETNGGETIHDNDQEMNIFSTKSSNFESIESTMKPIIHRIKELTVDQSDISTVLMNIVTNVPPSKKEIGENNEIYDQKNVDSMINNIETHPNSKHENSDISNYLKQMNENDLGNISNNDKDVAEYLLNKKIIEEIKRINILMDEIKTFNKSVSYDPIIIFKNDSLHGIIEKLRSKRNVQIGQRNERSKTDTHAKNAKYINELMSYVEEYEKLKRKKRSLFSRFTVFDDDEVTLPTQSGESTTLFAVHKGPKKDFRLKRSISEEDYNAKEAKKRAKKSGDDFNMKQVYGQKLSKSKEKYYYPRMETHDPGNVLWNQVKKDYETNTEIRRIIDREHTNEEVIESHMWNCKKKYGREKREIRSRERKISPSEEEYLDREYVKKMRADHKKRCENDESPETTEGTTIDTRFLDVSRSRARNPINVEDLDISNPDEFMKKLRKRDITANNEDVFQRYDPDDDNFVENLAKHALRKKRHLKKDTKKDVFKNHIRQARGVFSIGEPRQERRKNKNGARRKRSLFLHKLRPRLPRRRRQAEGKYEPLSVEQTLRPDPLSVEKVDRIPEYDMYHGFKYGVTEVFEEDIDVTGIYTRYTANTPGKYQMKRYEAFRQYMLAASSTFRDPFIKVSFAVCPFCGDYFGNRKKLLFHEDYEHFNVISTVVPVTFQPTATVKGAVKDKDMNDVFELILKNVELAERTDKWAEFIEDNINPTAKEEYRALLFNKSITAFLTVPMHFENEDVKVISYPSHGIKEENITYPRDLMYCNKSIPAVNLYENPEAFMEKLINNEPLLPENEDDDRTTVVPKRGE